MKAKFGKIAQNVGMRKHNFDSIKIPKDLLFLINYTRLKVHKRENWKYPYDCNVFLRA